MPPRLFRSLSRLLILRVLQRRSPSTRLHPLALPRTRARTRLTMPFGSVALMVMVQRRRLQRTFRTLARGLVVSFGGAVVGGVVAGAETTGPMALARVPNRYW